MKLVEKYKMVLQHIILLLCLLHLSQSDQDFFVISDIHLDQLYDDPAHFCSYLDNPLDHSYPMGIARCDPPLALIESIVKEMHRVNPHPDFIIITGDYIGHRVKSFKPPPNLAKDYVQQLILSTYDQIFEVFKRFFPRTEIVNVLGNNDYLSKKKMKTQKEVKKYYLALFDKFSEVSDLPYKFLENGYYSLDLGSHIIVLNSNLFSYKSRNPALEAHAQLEWLEKELAESPGKAIITMHIPPGSFMYHKSPIEWKQEYVRMFQDIVEKHQDKIDYILAGHFHSSVFQLMPSVQVPILIHSAVSPVYGNNPAFRRYIVTDNNRDYINYSLDIGQSYSDWKIQYQFTELFGGQSMDLHRAYEMLEQSQSLLEEFVRHSYALESDMDYLWERLFKKSFKKGREFGRRRALCSFKYVEVEEFRTCVSKINQ